VLIFPLFLAPTAFCVPAGAAVEFITDVEGNWEYLNLLVARSPCLSWDAGDASGTTLCLADGAYLVHGGDVVDKGPGDIRTTVALVRLKTLHPGRVFLLLGNRDINKLRFGTELAEFADASAVDVFWDKKHTRHADWLEAQGAETSALSSLRWMLECTMGCQTTFETRRTELAELGGGGGGSAEDAAVLASFRDSVDPALGQKAWMLRYIELGQLMLVLGDILFIHGAVSADALGYVPGQADRSAGLRSWCTDLNGWAAGQVEAYTSKPGTRSGYNDLLECVAHRCSSISPRMGVFAPVPCLCELCRTRRGPATFVEALFVCGESTRACARARAHKTWLDGHPPPPCVGRRRTNATTHTGTPSRPRPHTRCT